jgi:TRAP-type C4-dicarboxylate transport system substrate-binding protein
VGASRHAVAARRAARAAALAVLGVAVAACSNGADKAGGHRQVEPLVLTLEQSDPDYGGKQFAAAVAQASGGSIRIEVSPEGHRDRVDFEAGIVEDVRAHRSDLGVVGARVWDTLGVTSFQALVAPFLVDSLGLEQEVLESPLAGRMLAGVDGVGLVGVALLPGPLRRPFGYRRALVGREDYAGARMGLYPGRVEELTLHNLGATTRAYLSLNGASREGAILNFWGIAGGAGYRGKTIATNVVFWPRVETVVMNRKVFEALSASQQKILRDAGRHAVGPRLAEVERLEQDALVSICERKLAALVTVPQADIAALHAAVRPVYAELARNAETRAILARIRELRSRRAPDAEPARCPPPASAGASVLEGRWESNVPSGALRAAGASKAEATTYAGPGTLELSAGRWVFQGDHTTVTGTYEVNGDVIRLTMRTCTANPCSPGQATEYDWSVYRDSLSVTRRPGLSYWPRLVAKPLGRVR